MNNLNFNTLSGFEFKNQERIRNLLFNFLDHHPRSEFLKSDNFNSKNAEKIIETHKDKTHFIHIGIGGSNLGTQTLINALGSNSPITFLANLDSDEIHDELEKIDLKNALIYVVSKSGETLETLTLFNIVLEKLENSLGRKVILNEHFVFCTDPKSGSLRKLAIENNVLTLELPSMVGGRFSVLTNVSYLPLIFCGIDVDKIIHAQKNFCSELRSNSTHFTQTTEALFELYNKGFDQTVLMPYSSKLKYLSLWFVQLWAESLGKTHSTKGSIGFTPLYAYGSTDQHSQVQLFMDGPKNKFFIFLECLKNKNPQKIIKKIDHPKIDAINGLELNLVLNTQLKATQEAFKNREIPFINISIDQKDETSLVQLLLFFETLTSVMGLMLEVDPFDQPGVELGKVAFNEMIKTYQNT